MATQGPEEAYLGLGKETNGAEAAGRRLGVVAICFPKLTRPGSSLDLL